MLGIALLTVAVFGLIALGRANLYAIWHMPPSEAARQIRYYYVGSIPLALLVPVALAQAARVARLPRALPAVALGAWVLVVATTYSTTRWKLQENRDCRAYVERALYEIDSRIAAAPAGSEVRIQNRPMPDYCTGFLGNQPVAGSAGLFLILYPENEVIGRRVRFVESPEQRRKYPEWNTGRLASLFVDP
jgi:hypothetical protein